MGLALGSILASWTSTGAPAIGDAAVVLFAIASWYLLTTIQLWRAYRLVRQSNQLATTDGTNESAVANRHPSIR